MTACTRTFEMLGAGEVVAHYSCGVDVRFQNLPHWPANHDVFEERLPGREHPHNRDAVTTEELSAMAGFGLR